MILSTRILRVESSGCLGFRVSGIVVLYCSNLRSLSVFGINSTCRIRGTCEHTYL